MGVIGPLLSPSKEISHNYKNALMDEPDEIWIQLGSKKWKLSVQALQNIAQSQSHEPMINAMISMDSTCLFNEDDPVQLQPHSIPFEEKAYDFVCSYINFYHQSVPEILLKNQECYLFTDILEYAERIFGWEIPAYFPLLRPFYGDFFQYICSIVRISEFQNLEFLQKNICFLIASHLNDSRYQII
jgi:hypothetical protein